MSLLIFINRYLKSRGKKAKSKRKKYMKYISFRKGAEIQSKKMILKGVSERISQFSEENVDMVGESMYNISK